MSSLTACTRGIKVRELFSYRAVSEEVELCARLIERVRLAFIVGVDYVDEGGIESRAVFALGRVSTCDTMQGVRSSRAYLEVSEPRMPHFERLPRFNP